MVVPSPTRPAPVEGGSRGRSRNRACWAIRSPRDPVDLDQYAQTARERLVLKPAHGTGGAGVTLGWRTGQQQWRAAVAAAGERSAPWVLQSRHELASEEFPLLEPGFPGEQSVVDHNPIVLDGSVAGYYIRLGGAAGITNVTGRAGSVVPTFFVSHRPTG